MDKKEKKEKCEYDYTHIPNKKTIKAIEDAENGIGTEVFGSVEEYLDTLKKRRKKKSC